MYFYSSLEASQLNAPWTVKLNPTNIIYPRYKFDAQCNYLRHTGKKIVDEGTQKDVYNGYSQPISCGSSEPFRQLEHFGTIGKRRHADF